MRAAEQFVATEGHDVRAIEQRLAHRRLGGQPPAGQVQQAAAAEVFEQWQAVPVCQLRQFSGRHARGEALNAVVARVHPHDQTAARADGGLVVAGMGAVGGAHLDQLHPGAGHDVGNAEGAADFNQFAPGNNPFLARAQAVEGQQYRSGIVVDHGHRFGAGQFADQAFDQVVAIAALAAAQVELKVERITRGHLHRLDRLFGQQRPPEVGVQHRAGEVEHPPHMAAMLDRQSLADPACQHLGADFFRFEQTLPCPFAQLIQQQPQGTQQGVASMALGQRPARRVTQQTVDGR
ncbi:hypothetical protein D3C81_1254210 [compost metagenome]